MQFYAMGARFAESVIQDVLKFEQICPQEMPLVVEAWAAEHFREYSDVFDNANTCTVMTHSTVLLIREHVYCTFPQVKMPPLTLNSFQSICGTCLMRMRCDDRKEFLRGIYDAVAKRTELLSAQIRSQEKPPGLLRRLLAKLGFGTHPQQ